MPYYGIMDHKEIALTNRPEFVPNKCTYCGCVGYLEELRSSKNTSVSVDTIKHVEREEVCTRAEKDYYVMENYNFDLLVIAEEVYQIERYCANTGK